MIADDRRMLIQETSTIKELLLAYPKALRVLVDRQVPVSCAAGTVADAALACGLIPSALVAELQTVIMAESAGGRSRVARPARR